MPERKVWTFFYGSFINRKVLERAGLRLGEFEVGRVRGFDIRIAPLANLIPSAEDYVYGVVTSFTHRELARLYDYARDTLGDVYLPEAVVAEALDGRGRAALCYISSTTGEGPASDDYIDRIVEPARELGFPVEYIDRLEQFRPKK